MKIAIVQSSYKKSDILHNTKKIVLSISKAIEENSKLIFFPELSITGGYVGSIAKYSWFKTNLMDSFEQISKLSENITIVIGSYYPFEDKFLNAMLVFQKGKLEKIIPKQNIFGLSSSENSSYIIDKKISDEQPTFVLEKLCFSVSFFDDIKNGYISTYNKISEFALISDHTPFDFGLRNERHKQISNFAKNTNSKVIFSNQTGAHVHQIFDGGSLITNNKGQICFEFPLFKEDIQYFDTSTIFEEEIKVINYPKAELVYQALIVGIKEYFAQNGKTKAVIGLSGGIDSALVATLCVKALGAKNVHGILLPSMYSTNHSVDDAKKLSENLQITYDIVPIKDGYDSLMKSLSPIFHGKDFDITEENLQARLRAVILMSYSNKHGHLLVNTSNKSEAAAGYGTMYGDLCGGLAVIGDLYKNEVYDVAKWINRNSEIIPKSSIEKAPSAELRPGQKDSDSLPDYDILDKIVFAHLEEFKTAEELIAMGFDKKTVEKILTLIRINEYKRFQCPPCIRISKNAFGIDRHVPLVW